MVREYIVKILFACKVSLLSGLSDKVLWLSDTWPLAGQTGFWNGTYYWKPARRRKTEIKQKIWNKKKKKGLIPKSLILGWNIPCTLALRLFSPPNLPMFCKTCLSVEWIATANLSSIWTPVLQKRENTFFFQFLYATCRVSEGILIILHWKEHTIVSSISKEASDAGPHT